MTYARKFRNWFCNDLNTKTFKKKNQLKVNSTHGYQWLNIKWLILKVRCLNEFAYTQTQKQNETKRKKNSTPSNRYHNWLKYNL